MADHVEDQSLLAAGKLADLNVPSEVINLLFTLRAALVSETFDETKALIEPYLSWRLAEAYTDAVGSLVQP